jgi:hypothetical protein
MAGIFKKVASAFVEFTPEEGQPPGGSPGGGGSLEDINRDAGDLLAQLGDSPRASAPSVATPGTRAPAGGSPSSVMEMTADDVFAAAGLADAPSSSRRILKMLAGLSAFPLPQQLAMVRALDAADDTWSEPEVLADARGRQEALRRHLQAVEAEKAARVTDVGRRSQQVQADGQATVNEIDRQVAELQKMRQEALSQTASAVAALDGERQQVEAVAERAQKGINQVINGLGSLINFFTAGGAPPQSL